MTRRFRLGQSRHAQEMDHSKVYARERNAEGKRSHQKADRLETGILANDSEGLLALPDPSPWLHLPEATLLQRHSQWVDLELDDRTVICATLGGKLKGVKLVCGDRVRYSAVPIENPDSKLPQAQVVAVMPRRTLLKRGGIDDRVPWQLVCANADELWVCAAVLDPPIRPGLLERAYALALDGALEFRIVVTKRDRASPKDTLPELDPLREMGLRIHETSAANASGLEPLREALVGRTIVLLGHSGVGKSTLIKALVPGLDLRTGTMTKYGTGRQTTSSSRPFAVPSGGILVDTPGIRNLSVRGLNRSILGKVFPEFPAEWTEDPSGLDPEDDSLDLEFPERLHNLKRLWEEMGERNPNQNVHR